MPSKRKFPAPLTVLMIVIVIAAIVTWLLLPENTTRYPIRIIHL
jgi:uncharacterized ion transporter superfamily protein YfcC